jgi:hypothetical protein
MKKLTFFLLSLLLLVASTGCTPAPDASTADTVPPVSLTVDWNMTASVVQGDGTVKDTFPLTIAGSIQEEQSTTYLRLNVNMPKDFRYMFEIAQPNGDACIDAWAHAPGDFATSGYCYDKVYNTPTADVWAINTEKEYFIAYWGEDFGQFVVASTDPDVQPEEILEHFRALIGQYPYTS